MIAVEFNKSFTDILSYRESCKIFLLFKYNFLVMQPRHELMLIPVPSYTRINQYLFSKPNHWHIARFEEDINDLDISEKTSDENSVDGVSELMD